MTDGPTIASPWPRIKTTGLSLSFSASDLPREGSRTSMSVSPKSFRMSQTGTPAARNAALWNIGRNGTSLTPNGMTPGEWV